jgi:transposase-like protein
MNQEAKTKQSRAVQDVLSGAKVADVAKKYKIHESTVYWWLQKNKQSAPLNKTTPSVSISGCNFESLSSVAIQSIAITLSNGQTVSFRVGAS